jgi:5-hydroxyisourate hydrolase
MAGLTTHVLDTVRGRPAAGVRIELFELGLGEVRTRLVEARTNKDGRTDAPLIPAEKSRPGRFELLFYIGDYFHEVGGAAADPPFLDVVPIRFSISDPSAHYHVPLVATPWSYSTYRGS